MTPPATVDDIQALLGEVDDLITERILETRATADEVSEALGDLEDERQSGERRAATSAKVAAVREILEDLLLEEDEDAGPALGPPPPLA
jgi:hypothetical protein